MSFSSASGTKSLIAGARPSVRLPRRMVPYWVTLPIGFARPRRASSTPAMKVVDTAPRPGSRMPSRPPAGRGAYWSVRTMVLPVHGFGSAPGRHRRDGRGGSGPEVSRHPPDAVDGGEVGERRHGE